MTQHTDDHAADTASTPTPAPKPKPGRGPLSGLFTLVVVFALGGFVLMRSGLVGGVAQTPEFMPVSTDLSAIDFTSPTPVVVVVTADWCPPCQTLKRTTLTDESVRAFLTERAQTVMLDATDTNRVADTLGQLGVRLLPTTVVLHDGKPVAKLEGFAKPDAYLAWLQGKL